MIRIGEVRVVENIEELTSQLHSEAFPQLEILDDREVQVDETRPVDFITSHVAESPRRGRCQNRASLNIASKF